ncbi:sugar nucleotide-binding protein [Desulfosporosinus hippei]|uniref:dTDP-4-dehydrorhamnose reductase n=1 Tax=Desulfosporosinus hippei DSM 8344 TaxID=1121419 RepID=A0A1G7U2J4_9FIRM|nr:sugar nucleotide-binding protein [Desulfosporosinus hippei]SDG41723.1 dTDP-4-dehydrorhamnose reductase [Desulfosporosinus hippei DSM 8344]
MMNKVAIVGCNSFIGMQLTPFLKFNGYEVTGLSKSKSEYTDQFIDLAKSESINLDCLNEMDYVIVAAAISSPDKCENQFELCYKINVQGTSFLIHEALKRKCKVIFFSSDAVYGDDIGIPFTENTPTNPISNYGKMKNLVEMSFGNEKNFKALRLSYVFSYYDKFTQYYLSCLKNREKAQIFHPLYRNVICLADLLQTVKVLMERWESIQSNIVNVCGDELISRVNLADIINSTFAPQLCE